jgi:VWFA-related protein
MSVVKAGIRTLKPAGGTALYDAVATVLNDPKSISGRKAILLYSDGKDELSMNSLSFVIDKARRNDAVLYSVTSRKAGGQAGSGNPLNVMAEETGGRMIRVSRPADLDKAYQSLLVELRAQYTIAYRPPPGPDGLRRVEIRAKNKHYSIRARRFYTYQTSQ